MAFKMFNIQHVVGYPLHVERRGTETERERAGLRERFANLMRELS